MFEFTLLIPAAILGPDDLTPVRIVEKRQQAAGAARFVGRVGLGRIGATLGESVGSLNGLPVTVGRVRIALGDFDIAIGRVGDSATSALEDDSVRR